MQNVFTQCELGGPLLRQGAPSSPCQPLQQPLHCTAGSDEATRIGDEVVAGNQLVRTLIIEGELSATIQREEDQHAIRDTVNRQHQGVDTDWLQDFVSEVHVSTSGF